MDEVALRFQRIEKSLKAKPWFKKEKWLASVHGFPRGKPEFVTFHVFKKHWFNEDSQGIHIESYLAIDPKKRKKSYVTIHVLHHALVPGTKLKRTVISQPFVDEVFKEVSSWPGYKFRAGKYGTQPFTRMLDGSHPDFDSTLEREVERLCVKLGPVMDKILASLDTDTVK